MSEGGGPTLSRRALEVARLVALGLTNRQIAQHLSLSERTVEWHLDQILNRLGYSSRSQLAAWVGRTQSGVAIRAPGPRVRGNLPAPITNFIGRLDDLANLRRLTASGRLVTVTGPGGVGKTRLALSLAREMEPATADGAWLCELAPLVDGRQVPDAIAHALGVEPGPRGSAAAVADHVRERNLLLILDTCEHLLSAAAEAVEQLLTAGDGVRLLATSRAPLGLAGEVVWQLGPMDRGDAVRLFFERAREALPAFDLAGSPEAVEALCDQLERMPLALELAASWLRAFRLSELADAVLELDGGGRPGPRHASLAAVADWSYRLLKPGAQLLFGQLSVFSRWFDEEDAVAVDAAKNGVRKGLAELVESSMLLREPGPSGRDRYRLLEVLQPFAEERLTSSGEATQVRLAHAERMLQLAERLDLRRDESPFDVYPKVLAMIDDMRAALAVLLELRPPQAARLAAALLFVWRDSGRMAEGLDWTEAALAAHPERSAERCWLLYGCAILLYAIDRPAEAEAAYKEAVELAELPECSDRRGDLLLRAAAVHNCRGDWEASEAAQRQAVEVFVAAGRELSAARALNHLALSLLYQGRPQEAGEFAERSMDLRRRRGSRVEPALETLAQAAAMLGDLDTAQRCWLESGALGAADADEPAVACALEGLAYVAGLRGRLEDSLRLHHCAQNMLAPAGLDYEQPLRTSLDELVRGLLVEVGEDSAALLRSEGAALTGTDAIRLAAAAGAGR